MPRNRLFGASAGINDAESIKLIPNSSAASITRFTSSCGIFSCPKRFAPIPITETFKPDFPDCDIASHYSFTGYFFIAPKHVVPGLLSAQVFTPPLVFFHQFIPGCLCMTKCLCRSDGITAPARSHELLCARTRAARKSSMLKESSTQCHGNSSCQPVSVGLGYLHHQVYHRCITPPSRYKGSRTFRG